MTNGALDAFRFMLKKLSSLLVHVVMLAIVCAIAAFWGVRILTPQPTAAPPPMAAPLPREPDSMLMARMFGLVQQQAQVRAAANIQVAGLFAAGKDSSAVLTVDGKPARVYVLGQDVAPGTRLVEVKADRVVLESGSGRQEVQAQPRPAANLATGAPARAYVLDAGSLSAVPSAAGGAGATVSGPQRASPPMQPAPTMPQPGAMPLRPGVPADAYVPGQQPPTQPATAPAGTVPPDPSAPQKQPREH